MNKLGKSRHWELFYQAGWDGQGRLEAWNGYVLSPPPQTIQRQLHLLGRHCRASLRRDLTAEFAGCLEGCCTSACVELHSALEGAQGHPTELTLEESGQ